MAAALQTIREIGDSDELADAVNDAFPGSSISVLNVEGRFEIAMRQHGLLRPLKAAERSQVLVVTHAPKLIASLEEQRDCNSITLEKDFGETKIVGADRLDLPAWRWASR
jgi:predicted ATPase